MSRIFPCIVGVKKPRFYSRLRCTTQITGYKRSGVNRPRSSQSAVAHGRCNRRGQLCCVNRPRSSQSAVALNRSLSLSLQSVNRPRSSQSAVAIRLTASSLQYFVSIDLALHSRLWRHSPSLLCLIFGVNRPRSSQSAVAPWRRAFKGYPPVSIDLALHSRLWLCRRYKTF